MTNHSAKTCRNAVGAVTALAAASALLVAVAGPTSAAAQAAKHAGTWTFDSGILAGSSVGADSKTTFTDDDHDYVRAYHAGQDVVQVDGKPCLKSSNSSNTYMAFWGQNPGWWGPKTVDTPAYAVVYCLREDGYVYQYAWGHRENYCVKLNWHRRVDDTLGNSLTMSANDQCPARINKVAKNAKIESVTHYPNGLAFTATFSAPTAP